MRTTANPLNTPPGVYGGAGTMVSTTNIYNAAFQSRHPGGANFAYGDGHLAFINDSIDLKVYQGLSTRAGEEVTPEGY